MKKRKIAEAMGNVKDKYINEAVSYNPKKKFLYAGISGFAALAACALLIFGISGFNKNKPSAPVTPDTPVDSVVCIDINPSIELNVSKSNKIITAVALNEDASIVLEDMQLENVDLKTALNAIIGSLLRNGYLDEAYNAVNVCVENEDENRADELGAEVSGTISNIFDKQDLIGDVFTETGPVDEEDKALADVYGISVGKLLLAKKVALNMNMELEVVVRFTIVELWDLMDAEPTELILKDEALLAAVDHAGVDINEITVLCNKIQVSDGVFIYLIKFLVNDCEKYTYQVDATTGEIIKQEYEYGVQIEIPDIDLDIDTEDPTEDATEEDTEESTEDVEVPSEDATEEGTEDETEDEYTPVVPTKPITKKEALAYAYADAGVDENEVKLDEIKHYPKENQYVIKFTVGMFDYEYLICGSDGEVLDKEVIDKTKVETDEDVDPLTVQEALELALEKAGVTLEDVTKYDIKYTTTKTSASYKIHFHVDKEHFEYNVDAMTGEITEKTHPTPGGPAAKPGPGEKPEPPKPHEKPEPPKPHEKAEAPKPAGPAEKVADKKLKPHEEKALKEAEEAVEGTKLIVTVAK